MKKILTLLIATTLTFNTFAATGTNAELARALENYSYALEVEWDQKDQKVLDETTEKFLEEMKVLMHKGLKKEEVLALAEAKMGDKKALEAIKLKFSLLGDLNEQDLTSVLKETSKDFQKQGASWNGDVAIMWGVAILFVGLIAYSVWFNATHECAEWGKGDRVCESDGFFNDNLDWVETGVTCELEDICVNWVKKQ